MKIKHGEIYHMNNKNFLMYDTKNIYSLDDT